MSSLSHNKTSTGSVSGFPPPRFLRMHGVGINLSDHSIKMMAFERREDIYVPKHFTEEEIPERAVEDGDIKEQQAVVETLKGMKDTYGLQFVYVSIPEEQGYIFSVEIPEVDTQEIHEAISVRLSEHVPLSTEESVFGWDVTKKNAEKGTLQVNVSVLPRNIVEEYINICEGAGLIPLKFEVEAQAIHRALMRPTDMSTVMIVDIGRTRTGVSIVGRGSVRYTATLDVGGDMLTHAIRRVKDVSYDEAEIIKQTRGFRKEEDDELREALINGISVLTDEVSKRFDYWDTHSHKPGNTGDRIEKIILCGGNASVPGLDEHISRSLEVPTEQANVWQNAFPTDAYVPELDYSHSLQYATAIGLALNDKVM